MIKAKESLFAHAKGTKSGKAKKRSIVFSVIAAVWLTRFTLALIIPCYVIVITSLTANTEIMSSMKFLYVAKPFVKNFARIRQYAVAGNSYCLRRTVCIGTFCLCVLPNELLGQECVILCYACNDVESRRVSERRRIFDVR